MTECTVSQNTDIITFALSEVCSHFNITMSELKGKSRKAPLPDVRKIACFVLYKKGFRYTKIAGAVNYRDHSAVCYAMKQLDNIHNKELRALYQGFFHREIKPAKSTVYSCPFDLRTQLQPFSNGNEFETWKDNNCAKCDNYESISTKLKDAKCKYSFILDLASVSSGTVKLETCKAIGCTYSPLYKSVQIWQHCSKFKNTDAIF